MPLAYNVSSIRQLLTAFHEPGARNGNVGDWGSSFLCKSPDFSQDLVHGRVTDLASHGLLDKELVLKDIFFGIVVG